MPRVRHLKQSVVYYGVGFQFMACKSCSVSFSDNYTVCNITWQEFSCPMHTDFLRACRLITALLVIDLRSSQLAIGFSVPTSSIFTFRFGTRAAGSSDKTGISIQSFSTLIRLLLPPWYEKYKLSCSLSNIIPSLSPKKSKTDVNLHSSLLTLVGFVERHAIHYIKHAFYISCKRMSAIMCGKCEDLGQLTSL